jgi:FlaA1/EpsC-like NDP-sugar epimerase
MSKIRLLVVGAGGHGRSVVEAAELTGQFEVVGLLDDLLPAIDRVVGVTVLGSVVSMAHHRAGADHAIVAIGNNTVREKLLCKLPQNENNMKIEASISLRRRDEEVKVHGESDC